MSKALTMSSSLLFGAIAACYAPMSPQSSALSVVLTVDSTTLHVGDSAILTLVVRNLSPTKVTYDVGAGNGAFDVGIERAAGGEVWRRSDQPSSLPATTLTILPGASIEFRWTLRVGGPGGVNLPAGGYKIRGFLIDSRRDVITTANPVVNIAILPSQ